MTTTDKNAGNDDTDTSQDNQEAKTFTQEEVNNMIGKAKSTVEKKFTKQYEDVDLEEYATLKTEHDTNVRNKQIEKGEFDQIMEETATKHNAEVAQLNNKIHEYSINAPIINAAAKHKAVDPDQVRSLIKGDFRLTDSGEVEVVDSEGKARYNSDGKPFTVDDRVGEFLDSNAHFVQATPSTTNTQTNQDVKVPGELDITKLDMKNPEDRARYAEFRKTSGLA